jgi:hypothetical protein
VSFAIGFLKLGADVDQIDKAGLYALKYAMVRRNPQEIKALVVDHGANINQID